jgi:hypothetical protein
MVPDDQPLPGFIIANPPLQIQTAPGLTGLTGLTPVGPDTTNALGKQLRAVTINETGGPRPGDAASFAFWKNHPDPGAVARRHAGRAAGIITTNLFTRYDPNSPVDLNRTIQRVAPET